MIKSGKKSGRKSELKSGITLYYKVLPLVGFFSFAGMMGTVLAQQPLTTPPSPATAAAPIPAGAAADTNPAAPSANAAAPNAAPSANAAVPAAAPIPAGAAAETNNATTNANVNANAAAPAKNAAAPKTTTPETAAINDAINEDVSRFCVNIDSQAADARFQLQSQQLQQLRAQIDDRIKVLEEKREAYELWLNKRNAFLDKAQDSLVGIITKMRPDAAAAQLALVDDITAASIILKLTPKASSTIMNELPAEKSASITRLMVSMQNIPQENDSAAATATNATQ